MTPTPEQFNAVADWLAECTVCGKEHVYRYEKFFWTWISPDDGHAYKKRLIGRGTYISSDLVNLLREQAAHQEEAP